MGHANLINKLYRRLSPEEGQALRVLEGLARERSLSLYLVGGSVRDLLLERPTLDIDLTLEGDAPSLARSAAEALRARCLVHQAFQTAVVKGPVFAFDLAMARAETYARPGALPRVRPASIGDDLYRRDFTINAVALALTGEQGGALIDPFGGVADMEGGLVRVLHERSFIDDATRMVRAVRYEARLGFRIEEQTLDWLRRALPYLESISGARLRQELIRILQEEAPEVALLRLGELGILAGAHPALSFDRELSKAFAAARQEAGREASPALYLAILASRLSEEQAQAVAARLSLTKAQRQAVEAMPRLRSLAGELAAPGRLPSQVAEMIGSFPAAALWAFALTAEEREARERVKRYLREGRYVKLSLDGHALQRLGVAKGPDLGEILQALKAAKLDGKVKSREDEVALVKAMLGKREVAPR